MSLVPGIVLESHDPAESGLVTRVVLLRRQYRMPLPTSGALGFSAARQKVGVHMVHTVGFGLGRIGAGLARTGDVFRGVAAFQGLESGSSPTSGTCFPLSEGVLLLMC
jgi:hypothetical protein